MDEWLDRLSAVFLLFAMAFGLFAMLVLTVLLFLVLQWVGSVWF